MILYFAQTKQKHPVQFYEMLPESCHTRYFKNKLAFFLLPCKIAIFWKVVSIDLLCPNEFISQHTQKLLEYIVEPDELLLNVCHSR